MFLYQRWYKILFKAFSVDVSHLLERFCYVVSPYLAGLIDNIESFPSPKSQEIFDTYRILIFHKTLKIERLEFRRIQADLILYFKIVHNLIDNDHQNLLGLQKTVNKRSLFKNSANYENTTYLKIGNAMVNK